ncbi:aromatic-amino-acid aminotransferase [Burkholderia gladioli]|uniref:Aromatic-amino-acid aminotransferase n=1 Tax=Burkholderia gladioli TaxID=28095 RepID=A0A095G2L6_BURGA|nr:amino acid aminotransferase [Burkholderia gladioli]AJW99919.1 aromatic-amino-acid aminotransferase [Burkholderia gladioli]ASD79899.1 aromatic amino acid aminotransferase [Burkholderia gladioli pv. gladioli]AWY54858.1 aromatic amino acid aminotransferase [Burkholderia gladioli pv. gladioli]KGC11592.1 aromatic-amino-acid aminotransferase [Burkholderia gladioli]PEH37871.1 aspartate/tyrosine/aromatic aminotransferase [Burkholderia gladioli]
MFSHVQPYAGDPILGLMEKFALDSRPHKVNLGVGIYYDEDGRVPVLQSVRAAAARVFESNTPTSYLPIEGDRTYRSLVTGLLFGKEVRADSLAVIQTLGGSGALKVGADFLRFHFPNSSVFASDPTWDNHIGIFEGAGFKVGRYRYYDSETKGLDLDGMLEDLERMAEHDIVLLHPCCHNPTGVDPTRDHWLKILDVVERRRLIPFVDIAYQGFAESLADDAFVVRELTRRNLDFLASNSFSKIFSLYGERCGALTVHCANAKEAVNVIGQLKFTIRRNYSSPPTQGMRLIATVLSDGLLQQQWAGELEGMRLRISAMRKRLYDTLSELVPSKNFEYLVDQRGMFAYTGLSVDQVATLQSDFGVYAVSSGRICAAGLNNSNVDYVGEAFARVLR